MRFGKPVHDVRTKLSTEAHALVMAEAESRKVHENVVMREIVNEWAEREFHKQMLTRQRLEREGIWGQQGQPHE